MAGLNSYTKLLLHLDASPIVDSSSSAHSVSIERDGSITSAQSKFGGYSLLQPYIAPYSQSLIISDSADWYLGSGDFTIDFWFRFTTLPGGNQERQFFQQGTQFCSLQENGSGSYYIRTYFYGYSPIESNAFSLSTNTWYHLAIVRYGNTLTYYIDGVSQGALNVTGKVWRDESASLYIFGNGDTVASCFTPCYLDEFRLQKGEAYWTAPFTPPTEAYSGVVPIDEAETISIGESASIIEYSKIVTEAETISIGESASIIDLPKYVTDDETISISEDADIHSTGAIEIVFNTTLRTLVAKGTQYATYLLTSLLSLNQYNTKMHLRVKNTLTDVLSIFNTELRVRYDDYNAVTIGSLDDFIVKLDGTELTDVDYNSLNITYSLNNTPSSATFILGRRHDNFNYKLSGAYSQIGNENKIEIYDGTTKIFTGYVTEIQGLSANDTVQVLAEDIRYKLSRISMELWYGGKWEETEVKRHHNAPSISWVESKRTIGEAVQLVVNEISGYLPGGYEPLPFSGTYVPEYVETEGTPLDLLTTLITQTANANWYIDVNERLCYQQVERGQVKTIPLSSQTAQRHAYDAVISDVTLNKQGSAYAQSLNVKLGTHVIRRWARRYFTGWLDDFTKFMNSGSAVEKTAFCFQQWGELGTRWYVGMFTTIYGYGTQTGWVLKASVDVQYLVEDSNEDMDNITVGSGLPKRTINLNSYGIKEATMRYEEKVINEEDARNSRVIDDVWLIYFTEENYNYIAYATDVANFELNQNNKLKTSAKVSMLLDAYKYYNINLASLINISNTIGTNIYNNSNGFPLNIDSVTINCANRMVELSLTNYSKSWYVKTTNYNKTFVPPRIVYAYKKDIVVEHN